MQVRSPVATAVQNVFHEDLGKVAERVRAQVATEPEYAESAVEPAEIGGRELAHATQLAREEILTEGAVGMEKLARDPDADLTPAEEFGVEAIVLLEGRPALLVMNGDFAEPPAEWSVLSDSRAEIKEAIARVGRIEVAGHPNFDWVGTGFLIGPDLVMTNRHVAVEFARQGPGGWTFVSGRSCRVDLLREIGNPTRLEFAVTGIVGVHEADDVDLALLRVEPTGENELPSPLRVAAVQPEDLVGRAIYVVGYPAWDGRRNEPEAMRQIFMDVYNVKRLQPGVTIAAERPVAVMRHDSSTLGGNSGSPVIDLATHTVIGLHYGGRYGVGNYAVPLWELVGDPLLADADINFADRLD